MIYCSAPRPTQAMGPITMTACEAPRNNPQMVIPSACQEAVSWQHSFNLKSNKTFQFTGN